MLLGSETIWEATRVIPIRTFYNGSCRTKYSQMFYTHPISYGRNTLKCFVFLQRARCNFISTLKSWTAGWVSSLFLCFHFGFFFLPGFSGRMHSAGGVLVRPGYAGHRQHSNYQQGQHMQGTEFDWNVHQNYDTLQYSTLQYSTSRIANSQSTSNTLPIVGSSRSYTVFLTSEEEKTILNRMIHMHMIQDHQIKALTSSHVQLLNTMFANKKKRLDCFNAGPKAKESEKTESCDN